MGVGISYMGTKRELASVVSEVIATARPGIMLDVFSGMCSVAETVGSARQVWTNDVQAFAFEVATAMFTSSVIPMSSQAVADLYHDLYHQNFTKLSNPLAAALALERDALEATNFSEFETLRAALTNELAQVSSDRDQDYCLFTRQYADTFIGLKQAIEIDSIIAAIRANRVDGTRSEDCARWLTIAIGRSLLRVSNTTGHFAQFLKPKIGNFRTFQRQRRREMWKEWLESNDEIQPVGTPDWRRGNRTFNEDSLSLLPKLSALPERPSVIYADPPYTNDQYSRFYHLFETLILYDYPAVSGAGLYREQRFVTDFSLKSRAPAALDALVKSAAFLGADLVLSYPTNGLIYERGADPESILKCHYPIVEICHAVAHHHSTLGASKGAVKSAVTEKIYMGRF